MAEVVFKDVEKIFDNGVHAVHELSLGAHDGEFLVLVGPSGCGKTTALRMIAGLEEVSEGQIKIGERVVNNLPPGARDVAMVFQNYALYPHMTVAENIGFALRMRKVPKADARARIEQTARIIGLVDHLDRKPRQLSGGQRQRVAMGRAIVREPQTAPKRGVSKLSSSVHEWRTRGQATPARNARIDATACGPSSRGAGGASPNGASV